MAHNKTVFRISSLMLSFVCLLTLGCQKKGDISSPKTSYHIVRPTFDDEHVNDFSMYDELSSSPFGINVSYYSNIYSRGFSWLTNSEAEETELYLVKSDKGAEADFSNATPINGSFVQVTYSQGGKFSSKDNVIPAYTQSGKTDSSIGDTTCNAHKVHVEDLEKGQAYSYKIGSSLGYSYGAFIVEKDEINSVTAVHLSDAQTKDPKKHDYWRNTFTKAVDQAGIDLDMVLYNGDQFDQNMSKVNSGDAKSPSRLLRYAKASDVIADYKAYLPYMVSSGNHEKTAPYIQYVMNDVGYANYDNTGAYYSYDYGFAHFTVLNTNSISQDQLNWLNEDLDAASNALWKVVMLHIAPYSTGDHSNTSENQGVVEKLTPIFSSKHVDLVLQAHDHTYNKTLPYKWDSAGYTTTWNNTEVVNFDVNKETLNDVEYDKNPQGTYYVTTGAAGHRNGGSESDGVWAEVVNDNGTWKGLNPSKTFLSNKYKIELGSLTQANNYTAYTVSGYTSDQAYEVGDLASGNVNAAMFGVLDIKQNTLSYHVYTVSGEDVSLFDTLDVLKA